MNYWIYENWTAEHKAVLHVASCPFCNEGRGVHPGSGNRNGRWHGPYSTVESAAQAAERTGRPVRRCGHCKP